MKRGRQFRPVAFGALDPWAVITAQTRFLLDCQAVVTLRMLRLADGDHGAAREAVRMVTEKATVLAGAQLAAAAALPRYGLAGAAAAVDRRYRRAVSQNRRRLSAGKKRRT
ncbi:MAG TPA: hypothetical protein VFK86_07915 [Bauldia sp.]|nr:hypothetical protein [Bauldia sp.]